MADTEFKFRHNGWIGFDLDGCLATYTGWIGFSKIGDLVPKMIGMLSSLAWAGWEVRIFTGRVAPDPDTTDIPVEQRRRIIRDWLDLYVVPTLPKGYPEIKITHEKDKKLYKVFDDRAYQVVQNLGITTEDLLRESNHLLKLVVNKAVSDRSGNVQVVLTSEQLSAIKKQIEFVNECLESFFKELPKE